MDFNRLIIDLLLKDEKVCIPRLGTLSFVYKPAEISQTIHQITPPSKALQFITDDKCDYRQFILACAAYFEIDVVKAQKEVETYWEDIKHRLKEGENVFINEVGKFKQTGELIIFEPVKEGILYSDSYGLDVLNLPLMEIENDEKIEPQLPIQSIIKKTPVTRNKSHLIIYSSIGLAVVVILAALYMILNFENPYNDLINKINASKSVSNRTVSPSDSLEKALNARANIRNALHYEESHQSNADTTKMPDKYAKCTKFYLVAGSFRNYNYALKFKLELDQKGYRSEILDVGDSIFRVTMKTFTNRNLALEELNKLLSDASKKYSVWLLSL